LSDRYEIDGCELVVGASIGIALSPDDGDACEELMRNADMALYRAKADGGGFHRFFERQMDREAQKRRDMEFDLRRAFANGEFELHYQPLVDIASDQISGFESLLRWHHPQNGMISPAEFIPVAEDIGLIVALGEWVLREACTEAAKWPAGVKVAVNLSPVQFRSRNLVQAVISALAHSGLSPLRLELEITESVRGQSRDPASVARARCQYLHGRFRNRLFEPELSQKLSIRQDQDRSLLCEGSRQLLRFWGDRAGHFRPRAQPQYHHDSRRRGNHRPARLVARRRL
jgi:predicted signal transduction protein with EAL and GGDEF domain